MRKLVLLSLLYVSCTQLFAQVTQTANDNIEPYEESFRPASNLGYYPPFTNEELGNLAAGNEAEGVKGVGIKTVRPVLRESFVDRFGYDFFSSTFDHYDQIDLKESTVVVGFPTAEHQDPTFYCDDVQSALFDNLYTPIFDNGENGTPINDENYYALYLYRMVLEYGDDIRFWEIWNEPGFDYTRAKGFLPPGEPGNWWDNNPEPCDYKLRAPIFHYIRMLRISYEIIHTYDPDSYVTASGLGFPSFLDAILRNTDNPDDGSANSDYPLTGGAYIDVIGYHSYPHFDGTLKVFNTDTNSFDFFRHSDAAADALTVSKNNFQDVLDTYGYDGNQFPEKYWTITEVNIPRKQISDFVGGDEVQRNFSIKAYVEAVKLDILQLHFYQLAEVADTEDGTDEFDYMGLYKVLDQSNGSFQEPTESGVGIKTTSDELFGKTYDPVRTNELQMGDQINGAAFHDDEFNYTYVLWAKTDTDQSEQAAATYSFPANLNLTNLRSRAWDFSETANQTFISGQNINLTAAPIFLSDAAISFPSLACSGEVVNFQALNVDAGLTYEWSFLGGAPATSQIADPMVTFSNSGTYNVSIEIRDGNTLLDQQEGTITILDEPTVSFESAVSSQVVVFSSDTNASEIDFSWDFGDGNTSTMTNPTHIYNSAGSFDVSLTLSNTCGSTTSTNSIDISIPSDPIVASSANDDVQPYDDYFRPAANLGFYGPQWPDEMLANLASGNPRLDIEGAGAKALRPSLPESFLETFGYDFRLPAFEHYSNIGNKDNTLIVGFPSPQHRENVFHCQSEQSELFAGMYEDIWDNGENGTPVNDDNFFALYLYNTATLYKDYVKFWEIWNEPGFDYTNIKGFLPPGEPGNWWDNDPDPCDYKLRAPVQYMVRMLRISYEVIKSVDEDALITFSGIGFPSFLDAVLRNTDNPNGGAVSSAYPLAGGAYFDVVGFHSYPNIDGSLNTFDVDISDFRFNRNSDAAANGILKTQGDFQNVLDVYGYDGGDFPEKHWIITECNIPRKDFAGLLSGEDAQVNYVIKTLVKSKIADMLQLHIYKIAEDESVEDATDEFQSMGLYKPIDDLIPGQEKITDEGIAFKTASDQLFVTDYDATQTAAMNLSADVNGAAFVDPDGSYTYVLWAKTNTDLSEMASATYSFPSSFNIDELIVKQWDFSADDDTTISDGQNISLTGKPIFLSEKLETPTLPLALFDVDQKEGCFPLTVTYSAFAKDGEELEWTFPGGMPATSTERNPEVTYNNPGEYNASLEVTNDYGEAVATETSYIVVNETPVASFTFNVQGLNVNFTSDFDLDNTTVRWEFGDGRTSNGFNPSHTYPEDGTYTVSFTVTNECGPRVITQVISVGDVLLSTSKSGCVPFVNNYTANIQGAESVLWTFPGGSPATSTEINPTVTYNDVGVYNVTLEVTTTTGVETFNEFNYIQTFAQVDPSFDLTLNLPKASFVNTSSNSDSYFWRFGDGATSSAANPTHDYLRNGDYEITLTASNACGSETVTQLLTVAELPQIDFTSSKESDCQYFSSYFVDETIYSSGTRLWIFEGGVPYTSTEEAIVVTYANPGVFNVSLIVENEVGTSTQTFYNLITHDEEQPTATFDHTLNGLTATFDNMSSANTSYEWDFGDGSISSSANPIHTYQTGGTYTVTLEVENGCGTSQFQQTISTAPDAFYEFTAEPECLPLVLNFQDESTGDISSRTWSFPGGSPSSSTAANPTVTYNNPGSFEVTLEVENQNGISSYSETIEAGIPPDANFDFFVEDREVTFTPNDLTADSYLWEFGDGNTSVQRQPVHTYDDLGSYTPVLIITDACGSSDRSESLLLNGAPFPQFDSNVSSGCGPLEVDFMDMSGGEVDFWQWSFPRGNPSSSTLANPTVIYETPGVYPVTLEVYNTNGSNSRTEFNYVSVIGAPTLSITSQINDNTVSFTSSNARQNTYLWFFGDGNTSSEVSPTHTYAQSGVYDVILIVENDCGPFEFTQEVAVSILPETYFSSDINSACGELTAQFYDLSSNDVTAWEWSFPSGTPSTSNEKNPIVIYDEVGTYPVSLTTTNAAGSSTTVVSEFINVYEMPVADFDFTIEDDDGEILVLFMDQSQGAASYLWDFGEGPWTSDLQNPPHIYPEAGEYVITLIVENDCGTNTLVETITVTPVSTDIVSLEGSFDIYPNPNDGNFIITGSDLMVDELEIDLYNLLGQKVWSRQLEISGNKINESFDLGDLPSGTYLLKLASDGRQSTNKIIVNN